MPLICGLRSPEGDLAVLYFAAGGRTRIEPDALDGQMEARWYNPRDGKSRDAERSGTEEFVAPDENDWLLLLQKARKAN